MVFVRSDYMSVNEIADLWGFSHDTALRWVTKYADKDAVEVHGGAYYVHKDEVLLWKHTYDQFFTARRLAHVPFKRLHELVVAK